MNKSDLFILCFISYLFYLLGWFSAKQGTIDLILGAISLTITLILITYTEIYILNRGDRE